MAQPKLVATTEFKIEKGIPVAKGRGPGFKYPLPDMEVGDSFLAPGQRNSGGATRSAYQYGKRTGKKFRTATVTGGVRIWRTA